MAMGIGIGMGISGAQQGSQLLTGWFLIKNTCAFSPPATPITNFLTNVPYKENDFVRTKINGPYAGKRMQLGEFSLTEPIGGNTVEVDPESKIYKVCQI